MSLPDPRVSIDADGELDVRDVALSLRHPAVFARFDTLAPGESFVLVSGYDPVQLHQEFARERPGAYDWRYLEGSQSQRRWRIRIIRITDVDLLRLL